MMMWQLSIKEIANWITLQQELLLKKSTSEPWQSCNLLSSAPTWGVDSGSILAPRCYHLQKTLGPAP